MYSSLEKLLHIFPEKNWNWFAVSKNPNISWSFVTTHLHFPWNFKSLSYNPNISLEIIKNNPGYYWCWKTISWRSDLTLNFVKQNLDKDIDWNAISNIQNLDIQFVIQCKDYNWNWYSISKNSSITWKIIQNYPNLPWNYEGISINPNINEEIVKNNPQINWDYYTLSYNDNITWEFIKDNLDKDWSWYEISLKKVNWDIVEKYPELPWNVIGLSSNINITFEKHLRNINFSDDREWIWVKIFNKNFNIPEEQLKSLFTIQPNLSIIYNSVKEKYINTETKEALIPEYFLNNSDTYIYAYLSLNPFLTSDIVCQYIDKDWSWASISSNSFSYEREFKEKIKREKVNRILGSDKRLYNDLSFMILKYI
jgi:hypothetical protein